MTSKEDIKFLGMPVSSLPPIPREPFVPEIASISRRSLSVVQNDVQPIIAIIN